MIWKNINFSRKVTYKILHKKSILDSSVELIILKKTTISSISRIKEAIGLISISMSKLCSVWLISAFSQDCSRQLPQIAIKWRPNFLQLQLALQPLVQLQNILLANYAGADGKRLQMGSYYQSLFIPDLLIYFISKPFLDLKIHSKKNDVIHWTWVIDFSISRAYSA